MEKSLGECLYEDLKKGNTKRALYIVKLMGDNVNGGYKYKSPLVWAKKFVNEEVIKALEEKGAKEIFMTEEDMNNLSDDFFYAVWNNNAEKIKEMAGWGFDVNRKNKAGAHAMKEAATYGHIETIKTLLELGADVDVQDEDGDTALMMASNEGYTDVAEKLIEAGANVNLQNGKGNTALMEAVKKNHKEIVEKLIDAGADVTIKNKECQNEWMIGGSDMRALIIEKVKEKKAKGKEDEPSVKDKIKGFFGMRDK